MKYFNPSLYTIRGVDFKTAKLMLEEHHYSKSGGRPSKMCFGLFREEELVGVAAYTRPSGITVARSLMDGGDENNVAELTRLYIKDVTGKNAESWFLSRTIKMLPKRIDLVVAYSSPDAGHYGGCYQASNFLYLGTGQKSHHYLTEDGRFQNKRMPWNLYNKNKDLFGSEADAANHLNLTRVNEQPKHAYVFPRKKYVLKRLNRKIRDYPKPDEVP